MKINVLFLLFCFSLASANEEDLNAIKVIAGTTSLSVSAISGAGDYYMRRGITVDAYVVTDTVLSDQIKAIDSVIESLEQNNRPQALIDEAVATRNTLISQADDEGLVRKVALELNDTFEESAALLDKKGKYLLSVHPKGTAPNILHNNISSVRNIVQRIARPSTPNLRTVSMGSFVLGAVTLFSASAQLDENTNPSTLSYEDVSSLSRAEK